jgi:hypothetical protein
MEAVLDPARHTGRAAQQVDSFLKDSVAPVLARYAGDLRTLELEDLRT